MSLSSRIRLGAIRVSITTISVAMGLTACGGGSSTVPPQQAQSFEVAKAQCGAGDSQETGLQGQVPVSATVGGFKGFNCNVQATSATPSARGQGIFGMFALQHDKSGHVCGYTSGAFNDSFGMSVVDLTDPKSAVETVVISTPGVIQTGESLRVNEPRGLLVANYYNNSVGKTDVTGGFDVYDVGTDCRHPQLLASTTNLAYSTAGLKVRPGVTLQPIDRTYGHEGWFAADGLTYYEGDVALAMVHAVDITDPTQPKVLDTFQHPSFSGTNTLGGVHGGSISTDGNRGYFVNTSFDFTAPGGMVPQTGEWHGGYSVVDTSEIQSRKPGGKMKFMNEAVTRDLIFQQHTIPVTIAGNKYVFVLGEGGGGQVNKAGIASACAAGVIPFATAQLFYMGDESNPQLINKTMLEAQNPKNCSKIQADIDAIPPLFGAVEFVYDVHHCAVDNRDNATTLACGYFFSGIRVFDIRDPQHIKEIAYYVPPVTTGTPKWCAAPPVLDVKTNSVYSWCADTGVVALKFANGVWPFPESSTPSGKQF